MTYFRTLPRIEEMMELFSKEESWLICINADPDAMASAQALKRIMHGRVKKVTIARINEVSRPDNLAMIRYTRIKMQKLTPKLVAEYDKFAMVDSQPHHNVGFNDIPFTLVIDHHPLPEKEILVPFYDIHPRYGSNSTILTEYLYNLKIRPGKYLATALLFGIKTDTNNFERNVTDVDMRAYQYLAKYAGYELLTRIAQSEFHLTWLPFFARACSNVYSMGSGRFSYVGYVDNPDILVNIADFFMRVYEVYWAVSCGVYNNTVVVVFRSDGIAEDVGDVAQSLFGELGSAGGHKTMARAEFALEKCGEQTPEIFVWQKFKNYNLLQGTEALKQEEKKKKNRASTAKQAVESVDPAQ